MLSNTGQVVVLLSKSDRVAPELLGPPDALELLAPVFAKLRPCCVALELGQRTPNPTIVSRDCVLRFFARESLRRDSNLRAKLGLDLNAKDMGLRFLLQRHAFFEARILRVVVRVGIAELHLHGVLAHGDPAVFETDLCALAALVVDHHSREAGAELRLAVATDLSCDLRASHFDGRFQMTR